MAYQTSGTVNFTTKTFSTTGTIDTTTTDMIIFADTTSAAFNLTLPTPTNGRVIILKDKRGTFATNNLTVVRHGSEKIDGTAASLVLSVAKLEITIKSDGTDWYTSFYSGSSGSAGGSSPTGSAGGDLSGTYPNPTVAKIQTKTLASSLASIGSAQDGYVLTWVNANSDWEAKATTGGGGGSTSNLTGPITATPVRTNSSNATYTIDSTGGAGDYIIVHNPTLTTSAATFNPTVGSTALTASTSITLNAGTVIVFNNDPVAYVILTTATGTSFTLTAVYQGPTSYTVATGRTFAFTGGTYILPSPTTNGRSLILKDGSGYAETNPIVLAPNGFETLDGTPFFATQIPSTVSGVAKPFALTNNRDSLTATGTSFTTTLPVGTLIQFSTQPGTYYAINVVQTVTNAPLSTPYTGATLSSSALNTIYSYNLAGSATVTNGTISISTNSNSITGSSTLFESQLINTAPSAAGSSGSVIQLNTGSGIYYIVNAITTNTAMTLAGTYAPTGSAESAKSGSAYALNGVGTFAITNGSQSVSAVGSAFTTQLQPGSVVTFNQQLGGYAVLTNGSSTVTGVSTFWNTSGPQQLSNGSVITFSLQPGVYYTVSSVSSNTSITLTTNYTGTSNTLSGTVALTQNTAAFTGTSTAFTTQLFVSDLIAFSSQPNTLYLINSVTNNTSAATVTGYTAASTSGSTITKFCQVTLISRSYYTVASIASDTSMTLTTNYTGTTSTTAVAQLLSSKYSTNYGSLNLVSNGTGWYTIP